MNNVLEINNITKDYKKFKIDNISFNLPKGYIMGFIGANGVGKTNVVEAIYYLSFARSFRTLDDKEFAIIDALIEEDSKTKQVHMVINKDGQKIICNKKEISKYHQ